MPDKLKTIIYVLMLIFCFLLTGLEPAEACGTNLEEILPIIKADLNGL